MLIREEQLDDINAISDLLCKSFQGHPQHKPGEQPCEHRIVTLFRAAQCLSISLVAVDEKTIVGHIALSPAQVGKSDDQWLSLGPVGVLPVM